MNRRSFIKSAALAATGAGLCAPKVLEASEGKTAPKAAITTPHYLATEAGYRVLEKGGNALEAIVAAGAVLAVVYPQMCTLGGDSFYQNAPSSPVLQGGDIRRPPAFVCLMSCVSEL